MNMTTIREKSKIFLWVCLIGFILSLVGVMGTSGGGFLGGASLTSLFSNSVNPTLYVGKVGEDNISRRAFSIELQNQRNTPTQFQISTSEQYYIGRAWEALIQNTITDNKIEDLNLKTQDAELKAYLLNNPPQALQNFLIQNNIFKLDDESFDLWSYQQSIKNNIAWMPDSLINIFANYETRLKNEQIPREKLRYLYGLLNVVTDTKIKSEYINSNSNCNIDVFSIDYTKINDDLVQIENQDITNYYNENLEDKFSNPESVTVDYVLFENITNENDSLEVILNEEQRQKADDFAFNAREDMLGFDDALINDSLSITGTLTITENFTNNSGLPLSMGYNRSIIRFSFDNTINSVSDKISTQEGIAVFRIVGKNKESNKPIDDVRDDITNIILKELKKDYAENLIENKSWDEIQKILNPASIPIKQNPFDDDIDRIKDFQNKNSLDADGKWGPASQKKYEENTMEENSKKQIAIWSKGEESNINGSFKTLGKNYKLMGCLSVMKEGETSKIIDANNKICKIKLNSINKNENIEDEKYSSIKSRLVNNISNRIYNSWIQYIRKNIEIIDIRHKAI